MLKIFAASVLRVADAMLIVMFRTMRLHQQLHACICQEHAAKESHIFYKESLRLACWADTLKALTIYNDLILFARGEL